MIDNFHYAKNISLPGGIDDIYEVLFIINPPEKTSLYYHKDWVDLFSDTLFNKINFKYIDVSFEEIAKASRY